MVGYVSLGLVCFLTVALSTHLFLKGREEKKVKESKESELNQKIESLLATIDEFKKRESETLNKLELSTQKLQQLEEENQRRLTELEDYKQKLEELETFNKDLLIRTERDNQRLQSLEITNKELLIRAESYFQKTQQLELLNKELSIQLAEKNQRIQQLEEDQQKRFTELKEYKQKQEELVSYNKELSIKVEGDSQRLQSFETTNKELLIRAESCFQKLQQLEFLNKDLSIKLAEKNQRIQQLEEEKTNQLVDSESSKRKIEELEKTNNQLLIESEGAKKLQEVSINYARFYENFLSRGLDTELDNLVKYQDFYRENFQKIEELNLKLDLEKNRIKAGKIYEGNWGERINQLFNSEELDYIELEEQPTSSKGDKGDFKLVFRNSRNKQSSTNSFRIMVELKYSFGDISLEQQFSNTKSDLRKALEVAKYSSEPYHFIFLVTNREFELEEYIKSETIWVVSDRDYGRFGLGSGRSEGEPIIAIMTPEASFKWIRMFYLMFWLAPTSRQVNIVSEEEPIEKLDQKIADFIRDCHNMTAEAEGASFTILKVVEKFFEDLERKFKQAKNKLLKSEKALKHVKDKNTTLWGEWKTLNLSFSEPEEVIALPVSEDTEL
ncbi:hypothetical protein DNK47_01030 [Mycoplasma wenyonii]|uniref:Uncharacterized protein n=2 Tax=Mycoplasma wenyonii TaxID=65123 RepID=A0A328PN99_9MOLU|nr:hypothetical protein DNK47_01030 [Mycoplasma wenyonii]